MKDPSLRPRGKKTEKKPLAIYMYPYFNGKRTPLSTRMYCEPTHWDYKKHRPKSTCPNFDQLNEDIQSLLIEVRTYFRDAPMPHSADGLINYLYASPDPTNLLELALEHFKDRGNVEGTPRYYSNFFNFLEEDFPDVALEDFDMNTWNRISARIKERYSFSTGKNYQSHIRTLLRRAYDNELIESRIGYRVPMFKASDKVESRPILTFEEHELEAMMQLEFVHQSREWMRDMICLFSRLGLRSVDWRITRENLDEENDALRILTRKTTKAVLLPLFPTAKRILEKYDYHIEPVSKNTLYDRFRALMRAIKDDVPGLRSKYEIRDRFGKRAVKEKWELLRPHDVRRTYATWLYLNRSKLQLEEREIMLFTGHDSVSEFEKYIGVQNLNALKKIQQNMENL